MSDLINREDAIKAVDKRIEELSKHPEFVRKNGHIDVIGVKKYILAIPSADRPQGEWIRTGRTNIYGGIEVQCSNCNDKVMVQHLEDEWYCRHCGADMGKDGAE